MEIYSFENRESIIIEGIVKGKINITTLYIHVLKMLSFVLKILVSLLI